MNINSNISKLIEQLKKNSETRKSRSNSKEGSNNYMNLNTNLKKS